MTIEIKIVRAPEACFSEALEYDYFDIEMQMDKAGLETEKLIYYFNRDTNGVFRQYARELLLGIKKANLLTVLRSQIPKAAKGAVPMRLEVKRGSPHGYLLTARVPIHQLGFKGLGYKAVSVGTTKIKADLDREGASNVVKAIVGATGLDLDYYSDHQSKLVKLKKVSLAVCV